MAAANRFQSSLLFALVHKSTQTGDVDMNRKCQSFRTAFDERRLLVPLVPLVALAIVLVGQRANAANLVVFFEGEISSDGSFNDPTGNFSQGDPISGFWRVNTDVVDTDPDPGRGA